jgi:DNA-binding transcriptional LysR family regulator
MPRQNINSLLAFRAVAQARSFTRAAAQLGVSPSALSHTIRALEERLALRLLARTTRSVVPSEAGERLLGAIGPHFDGIEAGLAALSELRDKPAGSIRITTGIHAAQAIVWPALAKLLPAYPDIQVELNVHSGFIDIVEERFDAGVRLGETIAQDMVAVRIGPDMRMAAVASPAYFSASKPLERRRTWPCTIASTFAFPLAADSTPGNSKRADARSMFGSKGSSSSTKSRWRCRRRAAVWVSRIYRRTMRWRTSKPDA